LSAFYKWKASAISCAKCGWKGFGSDAEMGEAFADGAEYHCPRCFERFGFKAWPMTHELEDVPLKEDYPAGACAGSPKSSS
jgi:hypothetical protein